MLTQIFLQHNSCKKRKHLGKVSWRKSFPRMTSPTLEPSPSIENTWDNLLGWGEPEGMLTARDMAQGDSVLKCKLAPQRMDCPLLPCTASCGVIRGEWCGQLARDYPGKKGIANDVSMPSVLRGSCNTSDSSPSLQGWCVCSGHVPAAHPFRLRWIAGVARVLTPPKHTHKGSINWHAIPSLMMKCSFCLRLLNLKLNSSWAGAHRRAGHGAAAERIAAQRSRRSRSLPTPMSCCHQTHSRSLHFPGMKTF